MAETANQTDTADLLDAVDFLDTEETTDTAETLDADPYAVLGVDRSAPADEIRLAYFQKVRQHPPERDPEGFKRVREAYDVLRSPRKRAEITLLELTDLSVALDQTALREAPPPPLPNRFADHLLAIALAEVDAALDDLAARGV